MATARCAPSTAPGQHRLSTACFASGARRPPSILRPGASLADLAVQAAQQAAVECQPPADGGVRVAAPLLPRRAALGLGASALLLALQPSPPSHAAAAAVDVLPAAIRPELAPDQALYDAADPQLRAAARLLQQALNAGDVWEEEARWTRIIEEYGGLDANWVPDLVGRAWGNRGNARSRQGRLREALADYNRSIAICPWSADPVLNRGVVLEALGRFEEAKRDYQAVLAVAPDDPAAWNNLGNACTGTGDWGEAAEYYGRAAQLAPAFSFALANRALALYQLGQDNRAIKEMRSLLRKYPDFPDMRAGLAAALWEAGLEAEAEAEWQRVGDPRYRDPAWLRGERRWPPRLAEALQALIEIRGVAAAAGGTTCASGAARRGASC